jgi:hypothetical protein
LLASPANELATSLLFERPAHGQSCAEKRFGNWPTMPDVSMSAMCNA